MKNEAIMKVDNYDNKKVKSIKVQEYLNDNLFTIEVLSYIWIKYNTLEYELYSRGR